MKAVLISIQPYWVFLIIAKAMGWNIGEEKTVEVRKTYPKNENWDKIAKIYCSKNKKSFAKIPKEYQPLMQRFLGKIIGEFVCDDIKAFDIPYPAFQNEMDKTIIEKSCVSYYDLHRYAGHDCLFGWHISDLVIYDKPKELSEFKRDCDGNCQTCKYAIWQTSGIAYEPYIVDCQPITRPPMDWFYIWESEVQP